MSKGHLRALHEEYGDDGIVAASYPGTQLDAATVFVEDIQDVFASDAIIVNLSHQVVFGTPFETGVAWVNGAVIVFIDPEDAFGNHPFVKGLQDTDDAGAVYIVRSVEEAIDVVRSLSTY